MKPPAELFSLAGRVALVTGSTRGLGWAMAQALAAAGAFVCVNGRDEALARERAAALRGEAHAGDVTDEATAQSIVDAVIARHGRLDILVNNAGSIWRGALDAHDSAEWHRVMDLNLNAAFLLSRRAVREMASRGHGRIVNIGSVFSSIARAGAPSYVTSKHALVGLTRALAVEYARRGVTCNLIGPGYIATELNASLRADPAFSERVVRRTPAGRWGEPQDLAGAVVFLASDAAAYVNGVVLNVDGGMVAAF